jgi:hypothetical protein
LAELSGQSGGKNLTAEKKLKLKQIIAILKSFNLKKVPLKKLQKGPYFFRFGQTGWLESLDRAWQHCEVSRDGMFLQLAVT